MSNLSPREALKRIEQFSDSGDYAIAIVKMKAIATEALAYKGKDKELLEAIKGMDKRTNALYLELPELVADDVKKAWVNVKYLIQSQYS